MANFSTAITSGASSAADALANRSQDAAPDHDKKILGAAKDFEALLLGQMLRSMHEEDGWLGTGDDQAGEAAIGLGEEQLARTMAASGGLGLSRVIESGLRSQHEAGSPASATSAPAGRLR